MKKSFIITVLMALAISGFSQINYQFDFSYVCETGQTLYYRIIDEEEHTVMLTYPYSTNHPGFSGEYYQGYPKPQGEIILPSTVTYNDIAYSVTTIDNYAFHNCEDLTGTLAIPEGIESIGREAFYYCHFSSIVIPRSVSFIDPAAFRLCENRNFVYVDDNNPTYYSENNAVINKDGKTMLLACNTTTIPDYIEIIGSYAFSGIGNEGDLVIPNSVKSIEENAFEESHFLGSLMLSESLETIGYSAFRSSRFTGSLTIPNSVTEIGGCAFLSAGFTGNLTLPSSISNIIGHAFAYTNFTGTLTIPNSVTEIGTKAFFRTEFNELVLGSSVEKIKASAFDECINLSGTLILPSSVNEIGVGAFRQTAFNKIYSHNPVPPSLINSNAFYGYETTTPIHIPFGCTEAYQNAEGWNYFTNFIESEMNLEGEWYYEIQNDDGSITYQHLRAEGDTTIHEKRPKIIIRSNTQYDSKGVSTMVTHEYVYEENGIVYWWNKDLEEFTTLYNLSANVGDDWEIKVGTETIAMHVDAIEYSEHKFRSYKILHVSDPENLFSGKIICGIGHLTSFFPEKLMNRNARYSVDGLRCYWVNDVLVYHKGTVDCDEIHVQYHNGIDETKENGFMVYPNPTNGILFVETVCTPSLPAVQEYRITNLMGQTLLQGNINVETQQIDISILPAGMYFISVNEQTVKFVKQ